MTAELALRLAISLAVLSNVQPNPLKPANAVIAPPSTAPSIMRVNDFSSSIVEVDSVMTFPLDGLRCREAADTRMGPGRKVA